MKGVPANVDEPLGPWFKKVRAAVATVSVGDSRERVVDVLGPPDEILRDAVSAGGQLQGLLDSLADGDTAIRYGDKNPFPETLVYRDPYRPRKRYAFGMRDGAVSAMWQETIAIGASQS
jgi:hypothetical protein